MSAREKLVQSQKNHKKMIKKLDKQKNVWYYVIVSTRKVPDTEPEMQKHFKQININDF